MDNSVFLAACGSYGQEEVDVAVRRCLDHFGGAMAIVKPGQKLVLNPNLLMPRSPESSTTTHPSVMSALARAFAEAGADVVIAESAGGPYNTLGLKLLYKVCGMEPLADIPGVRLDTDASVVDVTYHEGCAVKAFPVIKPVVDADVVVSAAKMKTHGFAYFTGAVKNLFGVVPGLVKAKMHARFPNPSDFSDMLIDICEYVQPAFSIIDGVIGMEGHGPSAGIPKKTGVLVASLNPYAADLASARIMGLAPEKIPMLAAAVARKLVVRHPSELEWHGDKLDRFETFYRPATSKLPGDRLRWLPKSIRDALHRRFAPYPAIQPDCIGCGKCSEMCPAETIDMETGKARIGYGLCIKCYCCHEICPVQAIELVSPRTVHISAQS